LNTWKKQFLLGIVKIASEPLQHGTWYEVSWEGVDVSTYFYQHVHSATH